MFIDNSDELYKMGATSSRRIASPSTLANSSRGKVLFLTQVLVILLEQLVSSLTRVLLLGNIVPEW